MRRIITLIAICLAAAALTVVVSCGVGSDAPDPNAPVPTEEARKKPNPVPDKPALEKSDEAPAEPESIPEGGVRVVLVSVDGFRTDLVAHMPGFRRMMKHGSWTLRATTTVPSITTTAHASMFTGQPPEIHGVRSGAPSGKALKTWYPLETATIFDTLDPERHKPMAFVQKEKLFRLLPEDRFVRMVLDRATRESKIVSEACAEIANPEGSRMLVIHFKRFDTVGHDPTTEGWMGTEQIAAARPMDEALLALSGCIAEAQGSGAGAFALIVTADHGGHGHNHGSRDDTDMRIPWLVIGPGVKKDHEIRRDMLVMDTAAAVRYFLGYGSRTDDGIRGRFPREILSH